MSRCLSSWKKKENSEWLIRCLLFHLGSLELFEKSLAFVSFHLTYIVRCSAAAAAKSLQSCPTLCDPRDAHRLWSHSVRRHRCTPHRLHRPWDSPGKNIRVGCHFLLQCMKVKSESEVAQSCLTLSDPMDCSLPGSSIHGIFRATVLEWGAIAFSVSFLAVVKSRWNVYAFRMG